MLLVLLAVAMDAVPLIENPGSSLLHHHPRFVWLVQLLRKKGFAASGPIRWAVFEVCSFRA